MTVGVFSIIAQLMMPTEDMRRGGAGADIPPNQTLVFNMQLISVSRPNQ